MKGFVPSFAPDLRAALLAGLTLLATTGLAPAQTPAANRPAPPPAAEQAPDGTPFLIRLAAGSGTHPALADRQQVLR